jgi:hypothetical protein
MIVLNMGHSDMILIEGFHCSTLISVKSFLSSLRISVNIEFSHVALVSGVQHTEAYAEGEVRQLEFQQTNRTACEFGQQGSFSIPGEPCFECYTY